MHNSTLMCRFTSRNVCHQVVKLHILMRFSFTGSPLPITLSSILHHISVGSSESTALGTSCQKAQLLGLAVSNFNLKNVKHLIILSGILHNTVGGKREQRSQQNSSILFLRHWQSKLRVAAGQRDCSSYKMRIPKFYRLV